MRNIEFVISHVNGLYFEITADEGHNDTYFVRFIDDDTKEVIYEKDMRVRTWVKLNRKYLSNIVIEVKHNSEEIEPIRLLDYIKGKKVFITLESRSLGDTIAWMPCIELFRVIYNCEVVVSTFLNDLFESQYEELTFVDRGVVVENIFGMFELGWFYDKDKEPTHPATIPLQKAAKNILYLKSEDEFLPNLAYQKQERPIKERYVCISIQSTSQLKLWYYWQELVDWLKLQGYKVFEISKGDCDLKGIEKLEDKSLQTTMNYLYHSEFFIGLSSGISWLAWGLRKKVYMISNFSEPNHEFTTNCVRIINKDVCNGCWNNPKFKFDKGNWNYCPEHEDTPRQFECHKSILANDVIRAIEENKPKNIF